MAHSRSAKKRIRQNVKRRGLNRWRIRRIKDSAKVFDDAVHAGDGKKAAEAYQATTKALDQVAAKGTIHRNTAARRKSRLAKRLNRMLAEKA